MIPTAEEICNKQFFGFKGELWVGVHKAMVEFARLHVEEALKEVKKTQKIDLFVRPNRKGSKYKLVKVGESYDLLNTRQLWKVNKDSILNAYPLTNIK